MADVDQFIKGEIDSGKPFVWGETDCCSMADRWMKAVCGFSPLEKYGRTYKTEAEAEAWLAEPGGIIKAVWRVMRFAGFRRITEPRAGDVGLCVRSGDLVFLGIHNGQHWVGRHKAGWLLSSVTFLAWRVE